MQILVVSFGYQFFFWFKPHLDIINLCVGFELSSPRSQ